MRNLIVITIAVLVLLANYTAWNSARSEENHRVLTNDEVAFHYNACSINTEVYKMYVNEMTLEEYTLLSEANGFYEKQMWNIADIARDSVAVDFHMRKGGMAASRMTINERKEHVAKCIYHYQTGYWLN